MPLTSINKVVALFLVGLIVIAALAVIFWPQEMEFAKHTSWLANPAGAVALGLLLLASSSFFGALSEAIAEIFVRRIIGRTRESRRLARFFRQSREFDRLKTWEIALAELIPKRQFIVEPYEALLNARDVRSRED